MMTMERMSQSGFSFEGDSRCSKCNRVFEKPKLVQYYACPHCLNKIDEEHRPAGGCQYWFGYLNQKDRSDPVPQECVECKKAVDCMLSQVYDSPTAVAEIKKWY